MMTEEQNSVFDVILTVLLLIMVTLPALALGSVAPWAKWVLFIVTAGLSCFWLLKGAWQGRLRIVRSPVWIFIAAFFLLAFLQLVPLSPSMLQFISPGAAEAYSKTLPDYPQSGDAAAISLCPYATSGEIARLALLFAVFFIVVNGVRAHWQVTVILLALVFVGTFESLYGFAEHFSGHKHIFWLKRQYHMNAVTGTFHNKNHFAGLLEMAVPACLGLLLGLSAKLRTIRATRTPGIKSPVRLATALSSSGLYLQLFLSASSVIMFLAVFFSLSRAGILCALISFVGFSVFLGLAAGFRRYTIVMFLIVSCILIVAMSMGVELVIRSLEDVVSGESTSWTDRVNLAQSGLVYFRDFPLFGSGLGTFAAVFSRYQSTRFGDRVADFLHNDWLQLFCETGIIGACLVIAGCIIFYVTVLRAIFRRRDAFCKWTATGAVLGATAILLHSFFDYNLGKITSNGIIFAVLLGLSYAAATMKGSRTTSRDRRPYLIIPLGNLPVRFITGVVAISMLVLGVRHAWPPLRADVQFNQWRVEIGADPDDYFFLPVQTNGDGHLPYQDEAVRLDPSNPKILYSFAYQSLLTADEAVRQKAVGIARSIVGDTLDQADPVAFEKIVSTLQESLRPKMLNERRPRLLRSRDLLHQAIDAAPTMAQYHTTLANVNEELVPGGSDVPKMIDTALWLAPNNPFILFDSGRLLLRRLQDDGRSPETNHELQKVYSTFRKAIYAKPAYAKKIYPLVLMGQENHSVLLEVTPQTLLAYEHLCRALWKSGDWHDTLTCLNILDDLAGSHAQADAIRVSVPANLHDDWEGDLLNLHTKGAAGYEPRDPLDVRLLVEQRRCIVLGILGRWEERADALTRYQLLLRQTLGDEISEAHRLRRMGRTEEAMAVYLDVLNRDWRNQEILLDAAEIASLPSVESMLPVESPTLELLFRLIIQSSDIGNLPANSQELSDKNYETALTILQKLPLRRSIDKLQASFIRGAGAILSGRTRDGINELEILVSRADDTTSTWRQRHLIQYFLGLGYEASGDRINAVKAYQNVLELVPSHRPAVKHLKTLNSTEFSSLDLDLTQPILNINFGGKLVLLSCELHQDVSRGDLVNESDDQERWFIRFSWQVIEPIFHDYHPAVHFCGRDWRILFQADHRIRKQRETYPMDSARCGEVIVQTHRLYRNPMDADYLRVGIFTPKPPKFHPTFLFHDSGPHMFSSTVQMFLHSTGDKVKHGR